MADTAQEYRFPLPNELESLNSYGQTGHYGQLGGHGQHAQPGQGQTQSGQPGVMSQPGLMDQHGQIGQQSSQYGRLGHQGQPRQYSYRTEQRQVHHTVSSSSTGRVRGEPDVLGLHTNRAGAALQEPAAMLDVDFPPDVAAMMLVSNDNQKYDINEKHHEVVQGPHGSTEKFSKHQKRTGVNSTYENQEMMTFSTQQYNSSDQPQDDTAGEDQYVLRLVGATDVETGDHIAYGGNVTFGTDTPSEDSLGSYTRVNQQYSVSSQSQPQKYDSMHRSFSETSNVQTFTQHLAKIGQTEMEAVSLESLASFTQQQAKQWEDSPSDESLGGYEQRQTKVGLTTTTETTRNNSDKVHTLPLQKPKYDMAQRLPPEKPRYNTMRNLVSDSSIRQDVKHSHVRTHSDQTFQAPDEKDPSNRNIKEYFSYDVRPGLDMSPASSVASSRINVTVDITEPPPKVQSETVERMSSTTTQMVQGVEQKVTRRPPPPPVMPKPKTPDSSTRGYNFTERLVIRGVIPVEEQAISEDSADVSSDMFDPDIEAMLMGAGQQAPKQGEDHIEYVDGRCSCCPYGYHIDLTFLGFMAEKENLLKLKKIKRNKRNLRKSMEVYMQSQDSESQAPPPDVVHNESLLTMVEQDEKATKRILSEIDSSVNETIESIDSLIKSGPPKKRPKPPDPCDSDFSVSSGPQVTSSPRPAQSLNTSGSTSSLSSLESTDKNAPQTLVQKSQNQRSNLHTEHHTTTTTNITNIITSQQIAKSMEDCLNEGAAPSADPNVVTPDQLQAIRDQMKLSLQRMRELEEQVKAIPVLQVRLSVLKEEKRLLMLQMEAQKNRKSPTSNTRSIGVETDEKPRMRSVGVEANQKPMMRSVGVGECTVDERDSTTTGRRSRSQSPSGRSFEITEFQSYRRNNLTPMNKYFGKTGSGRSTPTFDGAETVDSAVGDGDVSKIYYIQPDLVTEAQFSMEMNSLRPDHVPELIRYVDKEQEEFDALERALATPVDEEIAQYSTKPTSRRSNERSEEFISVRQVPQQEFAQGFNEMVVPTCVQPRYMSNVPIVRDDVLKKESLHPEEEIVDQTSAPLQESQPEEDDVDAEGVNDTQQRNRLPGSHTAEYTHVHEKEVVYVNQAEVKVAPREVKQNVVTFSKAPELKKATRTIGVGDGNVFEQPKPKIIKPIKPQTRSVGSVVQATTRDVGIMFKAIEPEKPKPETREIGVGIGDLDEMKLIEVGEFGEYYHTVPITDEIMRERQQQFEKQQQESGAVGNYQGGGQSFGQRTIRTTSSTSYTERKNILLQEERIKTALRDALHRSVKSVAIMCKMSSHDKGCSTDTMKKWDKGCGDDTVDVDVRPATDIRSIGIDVKPQRINKSTAIDKPFSYNAMTNTPTPQPKDKSTNTAKVLTYPASIQTEVKRTYSVNLGTDMKVFMAMDQVKNTAVNTDTPTLRSTETNTERKALKSENYDFSIYFREGATNTLESSVKDLELADRGQNTMESEARDKEIEERIASDKARVVAMYAPSNGLDSADGDVGSGSQTVTTRTVRYETSPQVIVNRSVVSQEYTESAEGSMPIDGFSQSAGGRITGGGFSGSSSDNMSSSRSGSGSNVMVSGLAGGNMSGSGLSGSSLSSGLSGSSTSSGFGGSAGGTMSSGGLAESNSSTSTETVTRSTFGNLQMGSGSSRSSRMSGYGVSDSFPGGRFAKSSSGATSSGSTGSRGGSADISTDRSVETVTGSAGATLQMGLNMSATVGTGGEMDSLGANVQSDSASLQMSSSGSSTRTVSLSAGGTGAEHSTAVVNLSSGHSSVTTGSGGSSLREPLNLSSDSCRETDIIVGEVSSDLSSAPSVGAGLSLSGGMISTSGSVGTLLSGSSSVDGVSAGGQFVAKKPGSLNLSGSSSSSTSHAQSSNTSEVGSGEARMSPSSRTKRRSSSERSIQEMMGGNLRGGESEITATESSRLESGVEVTDGASMKGNVDGSLVFENKAVLSKFGGGLPGDGSESSFVSQSSSSRMFNLPESEESPAMTSSTGSFSEGSLGVTIAGNGGVTSGAGGRRVIVSSSETVTTYSSSEGSSTGSLDMIGEDRLSSLPGDTKNVTFGLDKDDSDSEPSQSDVFGQENNGTIIRKHVVTTTRSSIPVRSSRKEVRIQQTVDQNGNEDSNRRSSGSPIKESGFGLRTSGSRNISSFGYGSSPVGSGTIVEGIAEITQTSGSLSSASPSSDSGLGAGLSSYVSGVEFGSSPGSGFGYRSVSPGQSRAVIERSTETTYSTGKHSLGSSGDEGFGMQVQSVGVGNQESGSSLSPGRMRTFVEGSTELTQSSSGGDKDLEVLAQLKELEKDIESSHAKVFESMGSEYQSGSLEGDIEASHNEHFENLKSKFLSGSLHSNAKEHSETGESFVSTGAINLTPATASKLESSSITVTFGSPGIPKIADEEDLEKADLQDDEAAEGSSSPEMSKSVSEGSLDRSGSSGGSTGSLKSIMKRSGSFEGSKGQRKEIKFAVGTMGGAIKTTEPVQRFDLNPEMKQSCIVYSEHLNGEKLLSEEEQKAHMATIQAGWFKVSSERLSNPHQVEDYLSSFNELCRDLLPLIINQADTNGNCAIHYAVSHCNFEIVNLLLDTEQCNVNAQNRAGYTPIMLASLAQVQIDRHKEIVRRLFREGDVNIKASQAGQTALMLAVSHGKKDMVKLLLDCGADINAQDEDGSTALMCASEHGHTDIVKVLLAQPECDSSIVDQDGSTALAIAMEAGHRDIAVLLYAKRGPKSPVRSPVSGFHQFKFKGKSPPHSPKLSHRKN